MKCEHEGCVDYFDSQVRLVDLITAETYESPNLCRAHLAAWLREKADEVEGVKECEECDGCGVYESERSDNLFWRCETCLGSGKVPL